MHGLVLRTTDRAVLEEVIRAKNVAPLIGPRIDADTVVVPRGERGRLKQALLKLGWPAEDRAGYVDGAAHPIVLDQTFGGGWTLRPYQEQAVEEFFAAGSGVVVLPCGAGKTLVGMAAMARAGARTLILVTNTVASRQWQAELLARTSLTDDRHRRVLGRAQGDPAGHGRHLPDPHDPKGRPVPPPRAAFGRGLGADHLRRGPPAARAGVPDDRRDPEPPPPRD